MSRVRHKGHDEIALKKMVPSSFVLLSFLALLSGCCALAYEVLYIRVLTSLLGDMFYVHAALLSTFLVGIGIGAKLAHRWSGWLWLFELLTGLYALALPFITGWLAQQPFMSLITSSSFLTIIVTAGLISAPSFLIGFSIPLFSAYCKTASSDNCSFQWIYRVYHLGAFISILGVELVLIRYFGISKSLAMVGALNLFNGIVLFLTKAAPTNLPTMERRQFPSRLLVALTLACLASAVFQMFFLKLSYLVFYPHRENFAIALSIVMLGMALGAWLAAWVRIRFATALGWAAILIVLIYANYQPILRFYEATVPWAGSSASLLLFHKFVFGCLFALGPMTLFGALLPALMYNETEVARESGHLLLVASLANAVGYLLYVLLGHPLLTNAALLVLIVGLLLVASLVAAEFRWSKFQAVLATGSIILAALLIFRWEERYFYLAHWVNTLAPTAEVTVFKSGAESATLVRENRDLSGLAAETITEQLRLNGHVWEKEWISYNGHPSINIRVNGLVNGPEMIVGAIPALTSPSLDQALVIGLGTGITAGTTARLFKHTDIVEINEAFFKMAPFLDYANQDVARNPRAGLHLADGRAFLVGRAGLYDAVVNTVSAPTYFSASKIYTVDFYKRVEKLLKPGGVFSTWISATDMSRPGMLTILSALRHSFRYCELRLLWENYYLLTCSNQPVSSRRQLSAILPDRDPLVKLIQADLPDLNLEEFLSDILLSPNIFDHFVPEVPQENTDDHPVLEFLVVRDFQLGVDGGDPFVDHQDILNIDPVRLAEIAGDSKRLARRAATFRYLKNGFYDTFRPLLAADPVAEAEFFLHTARIWSERDAPAQARRP